MTCSLGLLIQTLVIGVVIVQVTSKPHKEPTSREDRDHFADDPERHDVHFDHTAFLGEDRVEEFSKLTPEESRERLKQIVKRIDKDGDGSVSQSELREWIAQVASSSVQKVTDKRWTIINPTNKESVAFEEYREGTYSSHSDRLNDLNSAEAYKKAKRLDERRWRKADLNHDQKLNREEFKAFLHPEEYPHMKENVIDEHLDSVDQDADGLVSQQEYIDDVARAYRYIQTPDLSEPDWLARERDQFTKYRDLDGDGKLNRVEVGEWILPKGYDPVDAEVQHLFQHVDSNQDSKLTEVEILERWDIFVNSQATNFGGELKIREEF